MKSVKFDYAKRPAVYVPLGLARDMQERGESTDSLKLAPDHVWWTVHHADNNWGKPSWISKGTGLVNRMGFIAGPSDMFKTEGDPAIAVFKNAKIKEMILFALRDIAREAEGGAEDSGADKIFCVVNVSDAGASIVQAAEE